MNKMLDAIAYRKLYMKNNSENMFSTLIKDKIDMRNQNNNETAPNLTLKEFLDQIYLLTENIDRSTVIVTLDDNPVNQIKLRLTVEPTDNKLKFVTFNIGKSNKPVFR